MSRLNKPTYITKSGGRFELGMAMWIADADIRINFRIIRRYCAISEICQIYPTYASMPIGKYIHMAIPNLNPIAAESKWWER